MTATGALIAVIVVVLCIISVVAQWGTGAVTDRWHVVAAARHVRRLL